MYRLRRLLLQLAALSALVSALLLVAAAAALAADPVKDWEVGMTGSSGVATVDASGNTFMAAAITTEGEASTSVVKIKKFGPAGNQLVPDTTVNIPDTSFNTPRALATDSSGNVYVIGDTAIFPRHSHPEGDMWVTKLDPTLTNLVWLRRFSTTREDDTTCDCVAREASFDPSGNLWVIGTANGRLDTTNTRPGAKNDLSGFVGKVTDATGASIPSTFQAKWVGPVGTSLRALTIDADGKPWVGGSSPTTFPTTADTYRRTGAGGFVAQLPADLTSSTDADKATHLDGAPNDIGFDSDGSVLLAGTGPDDMPTTPLAAVGGGPGFAGRMSGDLKQRIFTTGLPSGDSGVAVAPDGFGGAYVVTNRGASARLGRVSPGGSFQSFSHLVTNKSAAGAKFLTVGTRSAWVSGDRFMARMPVPAVDALPPAARTEPATGVGRNGATLQGVVGGESQPIATSFEMGTSPSALSDVGTATPGSFAADRNGHAISKSVSGLTGGQTYYYRAVAKRTGADTTEARGEVQSFTTASARPVAEYTSATEGTTSVTLNFTVDPNGSDTNYRVRYGTDLGNPDQQTPFQSAGSGEDPVSRSVTLNDLTPNTEYAFVVEAQSPGGVGFQGGTFRTKALSAVVTTGDADGGTGTALLRGTVNPRGNTAVVWFDYGPDTSYGRNSGSQNIAAANEAVPVSGAAGAFSGGTLHYRIVASGAGGIVYGEDRTVEVRSSVASGSPGPGLGTPFVPSTPSQAPVLALASFSGKPKASATGVTFGMTCANAICPGAAKLTTTTKVKKKTKQVVAGTLSFNVAANTTKPVTVKLNSAGKKLLKKQGKLVVTLAVTIDRRGGTPLQLNGGKLTIKPAKKKH